MNVLRLEAATPDIVLDELNQMKKEREVDEKRLSSLVQTKENVKIKNPTIHNLYLIRTFPLLAELKI